jgi:hypothetical protein
MLDKTKENCLRVKVHIKDHKVAYIAGATGLGCLIVGGAVGVAIGRADTKQFVDSMKLVHIQYKSPNINIALVKRACPDPIPVLDKTTGEAYASINRAAAMTKTAYAAIRNDAHGAQNRWERLSDSVFA